MHSVSQQYRDTSGMGFELRLAASIGGVERILTYDSLLSFKLSGNAASNEILSFGYVSACEVSFSIDNITGIWEGVDFSNVEWTLSQGKKLTASTSEVFQVGIFKTTDAVVVDGAINIKATDRMIKFEQRFSGINFPCTLHDVVLQCCRQVGITFATMSYPNMNFEISGAYQLTQITCRKVLSLVCELCGCFAVINEFGELEFRWFDSRTPVVSYSADDTTEFKPDKTINTVGGTSIIFNGTTFSYGSGNKMINLTEDNRLLMYCNPDQINDLLVNIYNSRESSLAYHTATFSSLGEPALEIGDVISVTDRNGEIFKVLVSGLIQSNNLKMDITSPPLTEDDDSVSSSGESGSIPRDTAESVHTYIAKNGPSILFAGDTLDEFLYQRFSSQEGATPLIMITLVGNCTVSGVMGINILLDNSSYLSFLDTVPVGQYLKTLICPIQNAISGNHTVVVQLVSSSSLSMTLSQEAEGAAGSTMIVQGSKIGEATTWDGLINVDDTVGIVNVSRDGATLHLREVLNDVEVNGTTGPIICQTISISVNRSENITLSNFNDSVSITEEE